MSLAVRERGRLWSMVFVTWSVQAFKESLFVFAELLTSTQIYVVKEILFVFAELLTNTRTYTGVTNIRSWRKFERWEVTCIIVMKLVLWLSTMSNVLLYLKTVKVKFCCSWHWVNCCHIILVSYHGMWRLRRSSKAKLQVLLS